MYTIISSGRINRAVQFHISFFAFPVAGEIVDMDKLNIIENNCIKGLLWEIINP